MRCFEPETRTGDRRKEDRAALSKRPDGTCPCARHQQSYYAGPRPIFTAVGADQEHGAGVAVFIRSSRGAAIRVRGECARVKSCRGCHDRLKESRGSPGVVCVVMSDLFKSSAPPRCTCLNTPFHLLRAAEHLAGSALDQRLHHVRLRRRQPRFGCPNARYLV